MLFSTITPTHLASCSEKDFYNPCFFHKMVSVVYRESESGFVNSCNCNAIFGKTFYINILEKHSEATSNDTNKVHAPRILYLLYYRWLSWPAGSRISPVISLSATILLPP